MKNKSTGTIDDAIPIEKGKDHHDFSQPENNEYDLQQKRDSSNIQFENQQCYTFNWSRPEWMGPADPTVECSPRSFSVSLAQGETTTRTMRLKNRGQADLIFSISVSSARAGFGGHGGQAAVVAKVSSVNARPNSDVILLGSKNTVGNSKNVQPVQDADWLTIDPSSGIITSAGSQDVTLAFNSSGRAVGDYYASLQIATNDPNQPGFTVPVHLAVATARAVNVTAGADKMAEAGLEVNVSFTIANTGGVQDYFNVNVSDTRGWGLNPTSAVLDLDPGETETVLIALTIPVSASEGMIDTVSLAATCQFNSGVNDADWLTVTIIEGCAGGERGDVNGDANINVLDVLAVVNDILGIVPLDENGKCRADCNCDGNVNVLDALGIVNVILDIIPYCGGATACKAKATPEVMEFLQSLKAYLAPHDFERFMNLVKSVYLLPTEFALSQNYPNPFNPSTDIRYQIADVRYLVHTTMRIYNILGQEVATFVDGIKEPGYYTVTWDATGMASGVYYCCLSAGDFKATRKMLLIK